MTSAALKLFQARATRCLVAVAICAVDLLAIGSLVDGGLRPAEAQWWGDERNPYYDRRQRQRRPAAPPPERSFGTPFFGGFGGGFGGGWGGGFSRPSVGIPNDDSWRRGGSGRPSADTPDDDPWRRGRETVRQTDPTRAPSPRKPDFEPSKHVLVLGDSMADWLAYGLEDAFAESGEFGVTRKHRTGSSLLRNDPRDPDWAQIAREALVAEKADFIVMMIGVGDRHAIRERLPARTQQQGQTPAQLGQAQGGQPAQQSQSGQPMPIAPEQPNPEQPAIVAPAPERQGPAITHEFRSEKWVELYAKRIDEVIAALKSKRVPVMWVGLPPIRGTRSRAEVAFLNDLYRARADRAGILYIDVWEGFVDDSGDYNNHGPDVAGQIRRLRTGDGVHFTKAGARKLAYYVDREIRRLLNKETPVALPIPDEPQRPDGGRPAGPATRPDAGPVISLTGAAPAPEGLLGARGQDTRPTDPTVVKVLIQGETPPPAPGRADNFVWPHPETTAENDIIAPPEAVTAARPARPPARTTAPRPGQRLTTPAATTPARQGAPQAATTPQRQVR